MTNYGGRRLKARATLRGLCRWKGLNIIKAEVCIDYIHMLIEIFLKFVVLSVVGFLKEKNNNLLTTQLGILILFPRNRFFTLQKKVI